MYGVKFKQDTIQIQEGTKTELEENGYEVFDTKEKRQQEESIWNIGHCERNSMPCR